jgi:hypothetical protein
MWDRARDPAGHATRCKQTQGSNLESALLDALMYRAPNAIMLDGTITLCSSNYNMSAFRRTNTVTVSNKKLRRQLIDLDDVYLVLTADHIHTTDM